MLVVAVDRSRTTLPAVDSDSTSVAPVIGEAGKTASGIPSAQARACATCHEEQFEKWQRSQHAWANRLVSVEKDGAAFTPARMLVNGSFVTHLHEQGNRFEFVSSGPDGISHHQPEAVIGIEPLRQYLVPFPGGRLQVVDVSYDPHSNKWFNAFGDEDRQPHEWGFWKNRSMNWNSRCAFCHMTGFEKNYDPDADTYASTWDEMGVSCAQCHGAGVETDEGLMLEACRVSSVEGTEHARRSTLDTQLHNCASCHARREELTGAFKAGDNFHDHFLLALIDQPGVYYPDGQVREENFEYGSFAMSRMHHKGVTCMDCHDPHSGELVAPAQNNALCLTCHAPPGQRDAKVIDLMTHSHHPPGTPGDTCIECHMPTTTYMTRDPRRDHGFTSPDPTLTKELGIPNACTRCHVDKDADWAIEWTEQWYGEKMDRRSRRRARLIVRAQNGDASVVQELLRFAAEEEIALWRASLISLLSPWVYEDEVRQFAADELRHVEPIVRAAAVRALAPVTDAQDQLKAMRKDPVRAVRVQAAWSTMNPREEESRSNQEVLNWLRRICDEPTGAIRMGQKALADGSPAEAEEWMRKAVDWDPSAYTHHMLGRVLHARGNIDGAIDEISQAAELDPEGVDYPYALALLYAEQGETRHSLLHLKRTVELAPNLGRAWYNLGLAHAQLEELDMAIASLQKAEELSPGSPELPYARATIHLRQDNREAAQQAAKKALVISPNYPPARALLEQLK